MHYPTKETFIYISRYNIRDKMNKFQKVQDTDVSKVPY